MATTLFLVFRDHGPAWVTGRPTREQPGWEGHARFMDRLFDLGRVVLGGPYADDSRALVIVEASDAAAAREMFREDPWTRDGVLGVAEVVEWRVFLDSRRKGR
jgi:uncharacterized protein YciI